VAQIPKSYLWGGGVILAGGIIYYIRHREQSENAAVEAEQKPVTYYGSQEAAGSYGNLETGGASGFGDSIPGTTVSESAESQAEKEEKEKQRVREELNRKTEEFRKEQNEKIQIPGEPLPPYEYQNIEGVVKPVPITEREKAEKEKRKKEEAEKTKVPTVNIPSEGKTIAPMPVNYRP